MINQNYLWWCLLYKLLGLTQQSTTIVLILSATNILIFWTTNTLIFSATNILIFSATNILTFSAAKINRQPFVKASHWDKQLWTAASAFKPDLVYLSMPIGSLLNLSSFARAPFCNSSTTSNRSALMWKSGRSCWWSADSVLCQQSSEMRNKVGPATFAVS